MRCRGDGVQLKKSLTYIYVGMFVWWNARNGKVKGQAAAATTPMIIDSSAIIHSFALSSLHKPNIYVFIYVISSIYTE